MAAANFYVQVYMGLKNKKAEPACAYVSRGAEGGAPHVAYGVDFVRAPYDTRNEMDQAPQNTARHRKAPYGTAKNCTAPYKHLAGTRVLNHPRKRLKPSPRHGKYTYPCWRPFAAAQKALPGTSMAYLWSRNISRTRAPASGVIRNVSRRTVRRATHEPRTICSTVRDTARKQ
jgi:hypothetical protein